MDAFSTSSVYLFAAILTSLIGVMIMVVFRLGRDLSARCWALGCGSASLGLILRTFDTSLPLWVATGVSGSLLMYSNALCGYGLQHLFQRERRHSWWPEILCLGFGAGLYGAYSSLSVNAISAFSAIAWIIANIWLVFVTQALMRVYANRFLPLMRWLFIAAAVNWFLRLPLALANTLEILVNVEMLNWLSAVITIALATLRLPAYFALRLSEARAEKLEISKLNVALGESLQEKVELLGKLTASNKAAGMGALVASLAHEVNQPLTAIRIESQICWRLVNAQRNTALDPVLESLQRLSEDAQRAGDMIRNLRNMFAIDNAGFRQLSLGKLVKEIMTLVQPEATRRLITLTLRASDAAEIQAEPAQLHQVILNLLTDAMQAIAARNEPAASGEPGRIDVRIWTSGARVYMEVCDNGTGFEAPFNTFIAPLAGTDKPQGMGLGLWLSNKIVGLHNGQLTLTNLPGGDGARVVIDFPCPSGEHVA